MTGDESGSIRRSVEVEYWVIDEEGRLVESGGLVGAAPGVEREFVEPLIEIKTSPCETTAQLREELFDRISAVLRRADELDRQLVPLSTPLNAGTIRDLPNERTRIQDRVVGDRFEYVRHCAGTHVHFEQQPGHAIDQLNTLVACDPALALVNSATHFRGEYLAPGARSKLYRWMAYDSLPHQGRLWSYVDDVEEWTRRLERRYEEFVTAAHRAGVDRRTVESRFDPESAIWTPVQLRETFGTVEWRSPDATLPSRIVRLADHLASVVERACDTEVRIEGETGRVTDDAIVIPEFGTVLEHVEAAIEEGLASSDLSAYLERMGFDVDAFDPLAAEFGRESISPAEARHLRRAYADRLQRDVDRRGGEAIDTSGNRGRP